jgi:hypothetical protein
MIDVNPQMVYARPTYVSSTSLEMINLNPLTVYAKPTYFPVNTSITKKRKEKDNDKKCSIFGAGVTE